MIGANSMVVNNPPAPPASNRSVPKKVIDNQNMGHDIIADASQQPQATQNLPSAQPMAIPLFYGTNAAGMMQKGQDLQQQQQQQHHQQHHQQQQQQQQHQPHHQARVSDSSGVECQLTAHTTILTILQYNTECQMHSKILPTHVRLMIHKWCNKNSRC